jgi:large subunit ribosomal protein LP0
LTTWGRTRSSRSGASSPRRSRSSWSPRTSPPHQTLLINIIKLKSAPLDPVKTPYYNELSKFGQPKPELKALVPLLKDKVALIFTNAAVFELKNQIEKIQVATEARVGTISPIDLVIPPGPTGLDPSQISFFHALQISTKIVKAQIEISKDFRVCTKGKKVTQSEAALLKKLNQKPFFFGMRFTKCYDSGAILEQEVLSISPEDILQSFENGVKNVIAFSLETGVPTKASIDFLMSNAVRNLAALSLESGFKVAGLNVTAGAPAPAVEKKKEEPKKEEKKKPEPKKEEPKEEEDFGFGDLF